MTRGRFVVPCLLVAFAGCGGGSSKSGAGGMGGAIGSGGMAGAAGTGMGGGGTGGSAGSAGGTGGGAGAGATAGATGTGGAAGTASCGGYDIDVPSAVILGTFKINGATEMSTAEQGGMSLRTAAGDNVFLGTTAAASYSVRVIPGTYDLFYTWAGSTGAIAPRNNLAKLRGGVTISETGATELNIDVPSVVLTGAITINGASVTSTTDAGYLFLKNDAGDSVNLSPTSSGSYAVHVVPGTYDLYYQGSMPGATAPRNQKAKLQSVVVAPTGTTTMDIDIPSVVMSGMLTLNGAGNTATSGAGTVTLRTSGGDFVSLGTTANGSYSVRVVPGSYDIYFNETAMGDHTPVNGNAKLRSIVVAATGPTAMDIDVPSVVISGTLKVNGAVAATTDYGAIYLRTAVDSVGLGVTSAGSYSTRVIPGSYDVFYEVRTAGTTVPGNKSAKLQSVSIAATGTTTLDVDVPSVVISGTLKINGATVTSPTDAGNLSLETAEGDAIALGSTSAGSYSVRAIPGTYDLTCRGYSSSATAPNNAQAKLRSVVVGTGATALDIDIPSASVTGSIQIGGFTSMPISYGNLSVRNGADSAALRLGDSGTYSARVIPGNYELFYGYGFGSVPLNGRADLRCFTVQ